MGQPMRQVICYHDTIRMLFRDLLVASIMMQSKRDKEAAIEQFIDTLTLIWETIHGEDMRMDDALYLFDTDITDKEKEDVRHIQRRKAD